jgi:hypothetical protein
VNRSSVSRALAATLAPALAFSTGCMSHAGTAELVSTITESHSIELGKAKAVEVYLDANMASLRITGGAAGLMDGEFTYNIEEWKPCIDYDESGENGVLTLRQPDLSDVNMPAEARCAWDIRLTDAVPISLFLDSGVGEVRMNLDGIEVAKLDLDQGIGSIDVDLGSDISRDVEIIADGGIGGLIITVPETAGVRLDADLGIGSLTANGLVDRDGMLVNEAYGKAKFKVEVRVHAGIGSITVNSGHRATASV